MGKYNSFSRRSELEPIERKPHPIWRGIGFAFMILIPLLSYFGMQVVLEANRANNWVPISRDMVVKGPYPLILVQIFVFVVLVFIMYAIFTLFTFILNSLFGAKNLKPYDVPPMKRPRRH